MVEVLPKFAEDFAQPHSAPKAVTIAGRPDFPVGGVFRIPDVVEQMRSTTDTLFIDPEAGEDYQLTPGNIDLMRFRHHPEWAEGREQSAHQVFFGDLLLDTRAQFGDGKLELPVAVKPYHTATRDAVHEYIGFNTINSTGLIESFHPIGLWVDGSGKAFLLSLFEEEVVSLDNVDWDLQETDMLKEHFEPFDALGASAVTLAILHAHGFTHGNAEIKNMAVDGMGVRLIDLTQLRLSFSGSEGDAEGFAERVEEDLLELFASVVKKNYLSGSSPEKRRQILESQVVKPYLGVMRHPSAVNSDIWDQNQRIDVYAITEAALDTAR